MPGQDLRDAALVDVADDRAMARPLDPQLDDLPLVQHCDPRLVSGRIDHDLPRHAARIVDCAGVATTIYFSGAISGGRADVALYRRIVEALEAEGHRVLAGAVAAEHVGAGGETLHPPRRSSPATWRWLDEARSSSSPRCRCPPSASATRSRTPPAIRRIPVIALYRRAFTQRCSAMISGDPGVQLIEYEDAVRHARRAPGIHPPASGVNPTACLDGGGCAVLFSAAFSVMFRHSSVGRAADC